MKLLSGGEDKNTAKLIGQSDAMQQVHQLIERIASTDSTVVILGETGTGKEVAAKTIHHQSRRCDKPFVAVNCGALPETLIESELFGHRKGSFTGADTNRTGLLEVADGGTLFLDEIGELPKGVQAKLLRFLESGEVRKIGDNTAAICNVRVICATLRHLEDMVRDGSFREDLWFRINTFEIHLPPLKDRKPDIEELAVHLANRFLPPEKKVQNAAQLFTADALERVKKYDWPGNIRQLANAIERALILMDDIPIITLALPQTLQELKIQPVSEPQLRVVSSISLGSDSKPERPYVDKNAMDSSLYIPAVSRGNSKVMTLQELEIVMINAALQRNGGNKAKAAEELGISLKTLYNKLNQMETRRCA